MSICIGVSSKARKVKKLYIGVGDKARKIKKAYIGVNGKARLFYKSESARKGYAYGGFTKTGFEGIIQIQCSTNTITNVAKSAYAYHEFASACDQLYATVQNGSTMTGVRLDPVTFSQIATTEWNFTTEGYLKIGGGTADKLFTGGAHGSANYRKTKRLDPLTMAVVSTHTFTVPNIVDSVNVTGVTGGSDAEVFIMDEASFGKTHLYDQNTFAYKRTANYYSSGGNYTYGVDCYDNKTVYRASYGIGSGNKTRTYVQTYDYSTAAEVSKLWDSQYYGSNDHLVRLGVIKT